MSSCDPRPSNTGSNRTRGSAIELDRNRLSHRHAGHPPERRICIGIAGFERGSDILQQRTRIARLRAKPSLHVLRSSTTLERPNPASDVLDRSFTAYRYERSPLFASATSRVTGPAHRPYPERTQEPDAMRAAARAMLARSRRWPSPAAGRRTAGHMQVPRMRDSSGALSGSDSLDDLRSSAPPISMAQSPTANLGR